MDSNSTLDPYQKSRSKVKQFSRDSADKKTNKHMDGRMDGRTDATKRIISLLLKASRLIKMCNYI